jgi:hypothetical protein
MVAVSENRNSLFVRYEYFATLRQLDYLTRSEITGRIYRIYIVAWEVLQQRFPNCGALIPWEGGGAVGHQGRASYLYDGHISFEGNMGAK